MSNRAWPKLTETLSPLWNLDECQSCNQRVEQPLYWREHDDNDGPTLRGIVLCKACADSIIEPHPRLYSQISIATGEPFPGLMPVCDECRWRGHGRCLNPNLTANGGPGLSLHFPRPTAAFVCRRGGGGGLKHIFHGPVKCDHFDEPGELP